MEGIARNHDPYFSCKRIRRFLPSMLNRAKSWGSMSDVLIFRAEIDTADILGQSAFLKVVELIIHGDNRER